MRKNMSLFTVCLLLSACASHLSQTQCMTMDWGQLGFNDGANGHHQRDLAKDIKDCARFDVGVDVEQYKQAWRAGTRQYCRSDTAYRLGVEGTTYPNICPADLRPNFERAWRRGLRKFCIPANAYRLGRSGQAMPQFCSLDQLNAFRNAYEDGLRKFKRLQSLKRQRNTQVSNRNHQQEEVRRLNQRKDDINRQLINSDLSSEQRRELHLQLRSLKRDIRFKELQVMQLNDQIQKLDQQIAYFSGE